ncbi:MAG TPA: hypothetical protein VHK89_02185 [Actinomycetota bacterium]|nr:hypothetical protein [Actinomycetota bacterium]
MRIGKEAPAIVVEPVVEPVPEPQEQPSPAERERPAEERPAGTPAP